MIVVFGASQGAVFKLCCPKCGEVQARARTPDSRYTCRRCGETIEVRKQPAAAKPTRARRRR